MWVCVASIESLDFDKVDQIWSDLIRAGVENCESPETWPTNRVICHPNSKTSFCCALLLTKIINCPYPDLFGAKLCSFCPIIIKQEARTSIFIKDDTNCRLTLNITNNTKDIKYWRVSWRRKWSIVCRVANISGLLFCTAFIFFFFLCPARSNCLCSYIRFNFKMRKHMYIKRTVP